jgi:hypothetical protein
MTQTNNTTPQHTKSNKAGSRRRELGTARRRRPENFSDAVVAAYIHEISPRRRPQQRAA